MTSLTIDMTREQHQRLESMAISQGKSLEQFALERLFATDDQAWLELGNILTARIHAGLAGELSSKSVDEILEEELAKDGSA